MTSERGSPYPHGYEGNAIVGIFRDKLAFKDFVTGFVDVGELEGRLDFERAEILDRSFETDDLHTGQRDIAWKVPFAEGEVFFGWSTRCWMSSWRRSRRGSTASRSSE